MKFENAAIPLGYAWASPFIRWQGALAEVSSLDLAVAVNTKAMADRQFDPSDLTGIILGWSVPEERSFYGGPTVAARIGAAGVSGPMISQACATSAMGVQLAASGVESDPDAVTLVMCTDRTSNGPLLTFPRPSAPGGAPGFENWVLDNFASDPNTGQGMLQTAENVAADAGITREEVDEVTLLRYQQYAKALDDDRAFQKRWMVPVEITRGKKTLTVTEDAGVFPTTSEGLKALKPVQPDGVVTFGAQTHPADGCASALITSVERARSIAKGAGIAQILGTGTSRVEKARMPKAPVPAARRALDAAGLDWKDVDLVTTHNPFAVNDVYFAKQTGISYEKTNAYGCSLVWGHPQSPTGLRALAELIEGLRVRGGGIGLFTGCAAGDSGAAVVVKVDG